MQITDALYPGLNIDGRNGKKYFAGIFSNPITASSLYVLALLRQDDVASWTQIASISADSDINSDESATAFLQAALPALNDTLAAEYASVPAPVDPTIPTDPVVPVEPTPVDPVPVDPTTPVDPVPEVPVEPAPVTPVDPTVPVTPEVPVEPTPVDPTPVVPVESWIERVARFLVSNTTVVDGFLVFATAGTSAPAPIGTDGAGTGSDAPVAPTSPVVAEPDAAIPVAIDQAPETQAPEAPVVETPVLDAPVVEVPDESVVVADPVVDAPVAMETPVVQEPGIVAEVPAAVDPIVDGTTVEAAVEPAVVASSDTTARDTDIVTSIDAPVVSGDVPVVETVVDAPAVVEIVEDNSPIVADANVGSAITFNPNDM